jgi:tRNASer (uridine44-2'-O)-methyltransferase
MAVRKRAPVASTEKPLRKTLIPSVNILYKSYSCGEINQATQSAEKDPDVEPEGSVVAATTIPSAPSTDSDDEDFSKWMTSPDLIRDNLPFTPDVMYNLNNFLLGSPNMNSPHLFRADIWYDSAGQLKTPKEKERLVLGAEPAGQSQSVDDDSGPYVDATNAPRIPGFELKRTVTRELIPRRPKLDRALKQTCLYYEGVDTTSSVQRALYLFMPDLEEPEDVPFYHPQIRGWGFLYDFDGNLSCPLPRAEESGESQHQTGETGSPSGNGTLSLHILPFPPAEGFDPFPARLERILQNLLTTHIRLARNTRPTITTPFSTSTETSHSHHTPSTTGKKQEDDSYNPDKDNIIPRHMVQNTYARLKSTYSQDLCKRWVENTEPAKHVFEDLAITAFLIELWRNMYGVIPRAQLDESIEKDGEENRAEFPGFVDIACGNGVLVYVLLMEGYRGWGFDARRRKTWSIFPEWVQGNLEEAIYIPEPFVGEFVSTASSTASDAVGGQPDAVHRRVQNHNGIQYTIGKFPKKTFVISNHADELTVWTPLLSALACPQDPLPFLSIPCCSHALSGARYRYRPPKKENSTTTTKPNTDESNPQTGDLKALRAEKLAASTSLPHSDPNSTAVLNSMYGSLTAMTMSVAAEVGFDVEKTLLRIPSTRNMGVIGGRRSAILKGQGSVQESVDAEIVRRAIEEVVERECAMDGGVSAAARIWVGRAMGLQKPGKKSS